ncbi:FAD-dependent monooxygenase [Streptomyces rubiginosohelvolus]|uniref:FAD-dependent monooxygenase n=1 Tax=Streptomyces rubiginosohelvolus TaxID=67362 RepID=UPI003802198D
MTDARHAVVSGASIAGLTAAYWLRRTGWEVTVLERAPAFRDGGQNVDVRGAGRDVLDRMNLTDAVRAQNTTETSTVLLGTDGRMIGELPGPDGAGGPDTATAELEILRGDFATTILDHLPGGIDIRYGDPISSAAQDADGVTLTTARGHRLRAGLLVIAEGVRSRTRDQIFAGTVARRDLGITMVFGTIPRTGTDNTTWRFCTTTGGRQIHLRPDNHGTTRAILAYKEKEAPARLARRATLSQARERYADAGWEATRVLDAFDATDDLYVDRLTQIRMPAWHRGRICLIGDAAWSVTPMGGGGASLALIGAYVLAACLSAQQSNTSAGDGSAIGTALTAYETWMRPVAEKAQKLHPLVVSSAFPTTRPGLALRDLTGKILTRRWLAPLTAKLTQVADTGQSLPEITLQDTGTGPASR